jgi:hypothetical protein
VARSGGRLAGTVAIRRVLSARGVRLCAQTMVSLSPDQTWEFFMDPNNAAKWDRSAARVEVRSPAPFGLGSTFDTIGPERHGQATRSSYRVSEVIPGRSVRIDLINSAQFQRASWDTRLEPVDGGTRILIEVEFSPKPQYFFLTPVLSLSKKNLVTDMRYLHDEVDAYGRQPAGGCVPRNGDRPHRPSARRARCRSKRRRRECRTFPTYRLRCRAVPSAGCGGLPRC